MSANATLDLEIGVDSYCTLTEVLGLIPARSLNATNTRPTQSQAVRLCRDIFHEVNAVLDGSLGYSVPVASGNGTAIALLRRWSSLGCAAQIELAAGSGNPEPSGLAGHLQTQFEAMRKAFAKGEMSLPSVAVDGSYIVPETSRAPAYQFDQVSGNEQSPTFTKHGTDW